jgi:hypothetical protein
MLGCLLKLLDLKRLNLDISFTQMAAKSIFCYRKSLIKLLAYV